MQRSHSLIIFSLQIRPLFYEELCYFYVIIR